MKPNPEHSSPSVTFIQASDNDVGQRLDNFLFKHLKGVPKSRIYKMMRKGECRVNKKRVKPEYRLALDDNVRIPPLRVSEKTEVDVSDSHWLRKVESAVIYEDDKVLVINKPSGLAVHGGSGLSFGLIETVRNLMPQHKNLELAHRLDRETSGCILIAKKRSALVYLQRQLQDSTLDKRYLALVRGRWQGQQRDVSAPLLKNVSQSGERLVKVAGDGKASLTKFKTIEHFSSASLIEAYPVTGRTHQIRVHCQFEGHAIMGDSKYGGDGMNELMKKTGVNRLFLHAHRLAFRTCEGGPMIRVEAPLGDLQQVVDRQR